MKTLLRALCVLSCFCLMFPIGAAQAARTEPAECTRAEPVECTRAEPAECSYNPVVAEILGRTSRARWQEWIQQLTGELPVQVDGDPYFILTRDTQSMFSDRENAQAFAYVEQTVRSWVPAAQIELDEYTRLNGLPWYNLIVTFPGFSKPEEQVLLVAHLDSKSETKPLTQAPGADDNATGTAALLEAVRIFREYQFRRTVKVIFFTGEELGMLGSAGYIKDHDVKKVVAVFNLDMFGYDSDGDRCFEVHAGRLPASLHAAQCVTSGIEAYNLNLNAEVVTEQGRGFSDHGSFWAVDTGAVMLIEDFFRQNPPGICGGQDANPNYHATTDKIDALNLEYGFDIARAGIAAAAGLAGAARPYQRLQSIWERY